MLQRAFNSREEKKKTVSALSPVRKKLCPGSEEGGCTAESSPIVHPLFAWNCLPPFHAVLFFCLCFFPHACPPAAPFFWNSDSVCVAARLDGHRCLLVRQTISSECVCVCVCARSCMRLCAVFRAYLQLDFQRIIPALLLFPKFQARNSLKYQKLH